MKNQAYSTPKMTKITSCRLSNPNCSTVRLTVWDAKVRLLIARWIRQPWVSRCARDPPRHQLTHIFEVSRFGGPNLQVFLGFSSKPPDLHVIGVRMSALAGPASFAVSYANKRFD